MSLKKVELKLNRTQYKQFCKDRNNVKFMKNEYISYNNLLYEQFRLGNSDVSFISAYGFMVLFNQEILKLNPWMKFVKETSSQALRFALIQSDRAYKNFFKNNKGFPKFIKRRDVFDIAVKYCQSSKNKWYRKGNRVHIPILGKVKLKELDYLLESERIKSVMLKQEGRKIFGLFLLDDGFMEYEPIKSKVKMIEPFVKSKENILGIDLGVKHYATCSNGDVFIFDKTKIIKIEKRIKRLQRKQARQFESFKKRNFVSRKNLDKTIFKIRCLFDKKKKILEGFIQKTVDSITRAKFEIYCLEDLRISNMLKNYNLSKSIQDLSFYKFRQKLINKCRKLGKTLVLADTFFPSSKRCSCCGTLKEIDLSERVYKCDNCGLILDRDLNASINLSLVPVILQGI